MNDAGIRWTSKSEYYDVANGEQITKANAKSNYIKLKTTKHVEINQISTAGVIKYTVECKKQPQLKLL